MTADSFRPIEIHGYAIVSDDDKIAGADGMTPVSLRNPKDWELYQRAQELADLVVFARRSHELEPNIHRRPRLVVSREAAGLEQRPDSWWWDPLRTTWEEVAARVLPRGGHVAVPTIHPGFHRSGQTGRRAAARLSAAE